MATFNSYDEDGRVTSVLLHLQHAAEMLLKAVLCQHKVNVFDKETGKSLGFEKCLGLCRANHALGSGLIDQSQKITVAARAMAERKTIGHLS